MLSPNLAEKITSQVSEADVVQMACDVINIPSPTGHEEDMARYMRKAMESSGLRVTWQEVEPGRPNVIGSWNGRGLGKTLMFNGHMDTSNTGQEGHLTGIGYKPHAIVDNEMIYGLGIYNMKGALVCYVNAIRALQRAGCMLEGNIIIASVVGEIEKTQWGEEFVGREYRGYGAGTHYLVTHGIVPDMCLLGEPTDMQLILGHYGSLWVELSTEGLYAHTAFTRGREAENSIRRMHEVLDRVYQWIPHWESISAYKGQKGIVNVGGIRGGHPWRASRSPERTYLFLDLRVPPTMPMQHARREALRLFRELEERYPGYGLAFDTYVSVPGAEISEEHPLVKTVAASHAHITGTPPHRDTVLWCSDASVMTRYGIETLNYGPSSGPRDQQGEKVRIKTLVDITKVYALTAAEICGSNA